MSDLKTILSVYVFINTSYIIFRVFIDIKINNTKQTIDSYLRQINKVEDENKKLVSLLSSTGDFVMYGRKFRVVEIKGASDEK